MTATTSPEKVSAYADHLANAVFPELRKLKGYRNGTLLRRAVPGGVEVVVITFWDSLASIRAFVGDDIETAVVSDQAAAMLSEFDRRVRHYEVVL